VTTLVWPILFGLDPPAFSSSGIGLQITVGACFVLWWFVLARILRRARSGPIQVLWHILLTAVLFMVLLVCVLQIPGAVNEEFQAITATTHLKGGLIALLAASFAFTLLQRLRILVRRRRQSTSRNWPYMLLAMALFSVYFTHLPQEWPEGLLGILLSILVVCLAGAMVVYIAANAFRVSWVAQLRGNQRLLAILIGLGLLAVTVLLPAVSLPNSPFPMIAGVSVSGFSSFLGPYSPSLAVFTGLGVLFGFLYILASVLSLLFNIPGDPDVRLTVDEMGVLDNLNSLMKSAVDVGEVAERVVEQTVEGYLASAAWIVMLNYENEPYRPMIVASQNISIERAAAAFDTAAFFNEVAGAKEVLVVQQVATDYRVRTSLGSDIQSLAVAPLGDGAVVSGALFIVRAEAYGFVKDDIAAIRMLTSYASLALEYARLIESTIERERLARELAIAREVQLRLLPQDLPESEQLSMAASSSPSQEVGGDFYDVLELEDGKVAVIVADVSGKGTSAAFYMAILQGIFRSAARLTPSPRDFLLQANRAISDRLDRKIFVTAVYGLVDQYTGVLHLARSGHCPAIWISASGEPSEWRSSGIGLGLNQGPLFADSLAVVEHQLMPGDVIVLYTDGLIEHRNADGEEYGVERLIGTVTDHRHMEARLLHNVLIKDLARFTGGQPSYSDDLTLVVLTWQHAPRKAVPEASGRP